MIRVFFSLVAVALLAACQQTSGNTATSTAQAAVAFSADTQRRISAVQAWFAARRGGAYVMNGERLDAAEKWVVPGWEDFPTEHYAYVSSGLRARVVVMPYDSTRYARWVVVTCERLKAENFSAYPLPVEDYIQLLAWRIQGQSSGIFPVAGVVIEAMKDAAGNHIARNYAFRDGVTVGIRALADKSGSSPTSDLGDTKLNLTMPHDDAAWWDSITFIGLKGRLQGNTRIEQEDFRKTAAAIAWVKETRDLYQQAWRDPSGHNRRMLEYARAAFTQSAIDGTRREILGDLDMRNDAARRERESIKWLR